MVNFFTVYILEIVIFIVIAKTYICIAILRVSNKLSTFFPSSLQHFSLVSWKLVILKRKGVYKRLYVGIKRIIFLKQFFHKK